MKKRTGMILGWGIAAIALLTACRGENLSSGQKKIKLDSSNPVSLTVWHYYNGTQQAAFDQLVEEFNATVGSEQGIYVEGYSHGSVSDLEEAVQSALQGEVGAEKLPDMFSSYADTAYAAQKAGRLTDIRQYFSQEELDGYVDSYIQEGCFNDDGALYLFPIAKATEILMINRTDWEVFAQETGSSLDELATTEGITQVSKRYYEWTDAKTPEIPDDGKAFYGRDSMSNYFIIGMKQMRTELFEVSQGAVTIQADKEKIRRLWDNYYIPYIMGYYGGYGRFRSDDVKTGDILAYTGSASSAMYFPDRVECEGESYEIDHIVLPSPIMEGGEVYRVQQGAGMTVTKSDETREYASCIFLKWFTQKEQNLRFVCDSAYLPVRKDANTVEALDEIREETEVNQKVYDCLVSVLEQFDQTTYYATKSFDHGYQTRKVLDVYLSDQAVKDKAAIDQAVAQGKTRDEAAAPYRTEEAFEEWYHNFTETLNSTAVQEENN